MRRLYYFTAALIVSLSTMMVPAPKKAEAQAAPPVTLSQTILPPDCYDTVNVTEAGTADFISVFECEIQRPKTPEQLASLNQIN